MTRTQRTAHHRIWSYVSNGSEVAIGRIGTRWFVSVGPTGKVVDAKSMRETDKYVSARESVRLAMDLK